MQKRWQVAQPIVSEFRQQFPEIPEIILQLLYNRGLTTQKQIDEFLNPDYSQNVHDPFLFKDMPKAVARIFQAITNNELIIVHGDYDADGVCSAVILVSTLKTLGAKHVDVFLPDRELDGYGINKNTVEIIAAAGAKLLLSCDCGISNKEEIALAQKLGLDVIITDHHSVPVDLPNAVAIIHPKVPGETYPDKDLCGAGVAFKLAQALLQKKEKLTEKWLLDLVAIATVADMVPLIGESRTLTKYGLIVLNRTKRLGLQKLFEVSGLLKNTGRTNLDSFNIGFQIAPRINAAGRVKHANSALQLLSAENEEEALELARELNFNNQKRQKDTEKMVNEALAQIAATQSAKAPILFVIQDNWPIGLIGLIASKLSNSFYKPVLVMTKKDGKINGSGRSIDEIDIMEKMVKLKDYFEKYGGHPQACGFTLKKPADLEKFQNDLSNLVTQETKNKTIIPILPIETEVRLDQINWQMYDWLQKFEPFGENNSTPRLLTKKVTIVACDAVGSSSKHLRLLVRQDSNQTHKLIGFFFGDEKTVGKNWCQILKLGDELDIVFEISVNEWNGDRELQRKIVDLRFAE